MTEQQRSKQRRCYFILEQHRTEDGGYIPVLITEGVTAYRVMAGDGDYAETWVWGHTIEEALENCEQANREDFGLGHMDALRIVAGWLGDYLITHPLTLDDADRASQVAEVYTDGELLQRRAEAAIRRDRSAPRWSNE